MKRYEPPRLGGRMKAPTSGRKHNTLPPDINVNYRTLILLLESPGKWFFLDFPNEQDTEAVAQFLRRRGCEVRKIVGIHRVRWPHRKPTAADIGDRVRPVLRDDVAA